MKSAKDFAALAAIALAVSIASLLGMKVEDE